MVNSCRLICPISFESIIVFEVPGQGLGANIIVDPIPPVYEEQEAVTWGIKKGSLYYEGWSKKED